MICRVGSAYKRRGLVGVEKLMVDPMAHRADRLPFHRHLFLARHGETGWNRAGRRQGKTDIPLSDAGREQARALAAVPGRASGSPRCTPAISTARAETAQIVAGLLGIAAALKLDARLRERGFGCFEGFTGEECAQRHPEAWKRATSPTGAPPRPAANRYPRSPPASSPR